ncbi:hypothetical protein Landi51_04058 [Colletotrichum acutatum]
MPPVTKASVRGFLGHDAAEEEGFLDVASTFIVNQIIYAVGAKQWPSLLHPVLYKYLPGFSGLMEQYSNIKDVVQRQMKDKKASGLKPLSDPSRCLYDLASRQQYLPALRQEVLEVIEEHENVLKRRPASKLGDTDSFVKEVQKFCSPDLTTFQRKATAPVTLSNGFHIPKGARIEVVTAAINANADLHDNPLSLMVCDSTRRDKNRTKPGQSFKS